MGKGKGTWGDFYLHFSRVWLQPPSSPHFSCSLETPLLASAAGEPGRSPAHSPSEGSVGAGLCGGEAGGDVLGGAWLSSAAASFSPASGETCWPRALPAVEPEGVWDGGSLVPVLPCSSSFFLSTSCLYSSSSWSVSWLKGLGGSGSGGASSRDASLASPSPR